jgi:hypothetical protein
LILHGLLPLLTGTARHEVLNLKRVGAAPRIAVDVGKDAGNHGYAAILAVLARLPPLPEMGELPRREIPELLECQAQVNNPG